MIENRTYVVCDNCKATIELSHKDAAKWLQLSLGTLATRDILEGSRRQWISICSPVLISEPRDVEIYVQEFCSIACARNWFGGQKK